MSWDIISDYGRLFMERYTFIKQTTKGAVIFKKLLLPACISHAKIRVNRSRKLTVVVTRSTLLGRTTHCRES